MHKNKLVVNDNDNFNDILIRKVFEIILDQLLILDTEKLNCPCLDKKIQKMTMEQFCDQEAKCIAKGVVLFVNIKYVDLNAKNMVEVLYVSI